MENKQLNIFQRFDVWLERNGMDDAKKRVETAVAVLFTGLIIAVILVSVGVYGVTSTLASLACG